MCLLLDEACELRINQLCICWFPRQLAIADLHGLHSLEEGLHSGFTLGHRGASVVDAQHRISSAMTDSPMQQRGTTPGNPPRFLPR